MATPRPGVLPPELIQLGPNTWTEPFWQAAANHRLVIPSCSTCGTHRLPPSPFCWRCRGQGVEWISHDGRGTIYTFTVVRHAVIPSVTGVLPLIIAVVELPNTDGCRLVGNLVDVVPEAVRIGQTVTLQWYDVREGTSVPCFRLGA
jgi:uncharacterized OB-fold protein